MTAPPGIHQAALLLRETRAQHLAAIDEYRRRLADWIQAADVALDAFREELSSGLHTAEATRQTTVTQARARLALNLASGILDAAMEAERMAYDGWSGALAGLSLSGDEAMNTPPKEKP